MIKKFENYGGEDMDREEWPDVPEVDIEYREEEEQEEDDYPPLFNFAEMEDDDDQEEQLEESKNVRSFYDFINESTVEVEVESEDDDEFPIKIELELPIHKDVVQSVQNQLDEMGSDATVEEVLEEFFMYNRFLLNLSLSSGYRFDSTYIEDIHNWIKENL